MAKTVSVPVVIFVLFCCRDAEGGHASSFSEDLHDVTFLQEAQDSEDLVSCSPHASVSLLQNNLAFLKRREPFNVTQQIGTDSKVAETASKSLQHVSTGTETIEILHHERIEWPSYAVTCPSEQVMTTKHMTLSDYDAAVASVHELYNKLPNLCNTAYCPQSDWSGCILRMAAHDFMDYRNDDGVAIGGSNGCFSIVEQDNVGLSACLYEGLNGIALKDAYVKFCSRISLADFLVIAAEAVMNITRHNVLIDDPHRKPMDFRSRFRYGRATQVTCESSRGKMPDSEGGLDAVKHALVDSLQLEWDQAIALLGAHTIGQTSTNRSGYKGGWSPISENRKFNNHYYVSLLLNGWGRDLRIDGNPSRNQWKRVDIGADPDVSGYEMMLNSDMSLLIKDPKDGRNPSKRCDCAWTRYTYKTRERHKGAFKYNNGVLCSGAELWPVLEEAEGGTGRPGQPYRQKAGIEQPSASVVSNAMNFTKQRLLCCGLASGISAADMNTDCQGQRQTAGIVELFANDEEAWIKAFREAWEIATSNGHASLSKLHH